MDYRRRSDFLVLRLDEGDEIVDSLKKICKKEKIRSAFVSGIGACKSAEIGHYNTKEKKYKTKKLEAGLFEIISLSGNVTIFDGEPMVHLHISLGLGDFSVVGGHLMSAEINPTCEIILLPFDAKIERTFDEKSGLKLMRI
jgi:predicted DNA-binding protein with PD1-like motif